MDVSINPLALCSVPQRFSTPSKYRLANFPNISFRL
jgi:hypothetical protein